MKDHWFRSLGVAAAAGIVALGVWALFVGSAAGVGEQTFVIEINDTGFNPAYCTVHRNDVIRWKNVGTKTHQVIVPEQSAALNQPPKYDSGPLAPGETTAGGLSWAARSKVEYYEANNPNMKAILDFGDGAVNCAPGLPTPTPRPTQTSLTTGIPPRCIGAMGCAVAPAIARDPD